MNDTSDDVKLIFRKMLMRKSGSERVAIASGMFDSARAMMLASFPKGSSPGEIRRMLLERTYPEMAATLPPAESRHSV
jgi:hypothetical protein